MTDAPAETPASNIFRTRQGYAIALKPWHADVIAANAENFTGMIDALVNLVTGSEKVEPARIAAALPGLRASLSNPDDLNHVQGLNEIVNLMRAVWAFNEIGAGLGNALGLQAEMLEAMVASSRGAARMEGTPTP